MAPEPTALPQVLGHPRGLFVLFFAELWERFSYYGMRALLIFYLTKQWLFSDGDAAMIYGGYTALVYIAPAIGGYLADRYMGSRRAVELGAVLLVIGHGLMAVEGKLELLWLALAFIIVGTGFLKANISVLVGQLYARDDHRRDPAYTIFYMGINIGALLGALICGYLGERYGWSYGFGAAGLGMVAGLVVFVRGRAALNGCGELADPATLARRHYGVSQRHWLAVLVLALVAGCWLMLKHHHLIGWLLGASGALLIALLGQIALCQLNRAERGRLVQALILVVMSVVFWSLFEQAGSSLNLFADRHTERGDVPASVFQSLNSAYIIAFAPLLAALWQWLGGRSQEPSTAAKFGLAIVLVGAGFLVLVWGSQGELKTPLIYLLLIYLLHTLGELCLSPVGLSAMQRLAPSHLAGLFMGCWFFASATGNFFAGLIAAASGGDQLNGVSAKQAVLTVYQSVGGWAVAIGLLLLLASPLISRLGHSD